MFDGHKEKKERKSYTRTQEDNEESQGKGRAGKMKGSAKDGFTVLLEASVQIRIARLKYKSMSQRRKGFAQQLLHPLSSLL